MSSVLHAAALLSQVGDHDSDFTTAVTEAVNAAPEELFRSAETHGEMARHLLVAAHRNIYPESHRKAAEVS